MVMRRVGFLGLGTMGTGMVGRLLDAGHSVVVWNRTVERAAPLGEKGATIASSPLEAAAGADVVIGMVADDRASRAVWDGGRGAVQGLKAGAVAIECSTLLPGWVTELAGLVSAGGGSFLDAPVTGSRPQA